MFSSQWSGTLVSQTGLCVRTIEGYLVAWLTKLLAWSLLFWLGFNFLLSVLVGLSEIILCSMFGSCLYNFEVQQKSGVLTGKSRKSTIRVKFKLVTVAAVLLIAALAELSFSETGLR